MIQRCTDGKIGVINEVMDACSSLIRPTPYRLGSHFYNKMKAFLYCRGALKELYIYQQSGKIGIKTGEKQAKRKYWN